MNDIDKAKFLNDFNKLEKKLNDMQANYESMQAKLDIKSVRVSNKGRYIGVVEFAAHVGKHQQTIYNRLKKGIIIPGSVRLDGGKWGFDVAAYDKAIEEGIQDNLESWGRSLIENR